MKFTLSWLKDHLDTDASLDTIDKTLTAIGLEVEGITDRAAELAPFTVATVIRAEPHPDADKLQVCEVDTGNGTVQVVCGAPNARTGMKGVFAGNGTMIPGTGMVLKPTTIRGVESNGMLVSEREMGLSDDHEGIIEMPEDAPLGAPFAALMGLDDPVIEIAITPNRQDCLGVRGIARDLAAAGLGILKPVNEAPVKGVFKSPIGISLDFSADTADACPAFAGRLIKGVKNGPSPAWLQRRLRAIGLRPISALVDVTNYIAYDRARPLHVFDADKIAGNLMLRLAQKGEKLVALDEQEYTLHENVCVIADDKGAQSIGGVMGGMATGCTEGTETVLLESALFDPVRTAMTGRSLGIESDARYRFERGVDCNDMIGGMEAATRMILELCGGEASDITLAGEVPHWDKTQNLRTARVKSLLGLNIDVGEMQQILSALGFANNLNGETIEAHIPSWRTDIEGEADLVEEIARIHGYDELPSTPLARQDTTVRPALNPAQRRARQARRILAGRGLNEAVTWSFTSAGLAGMFGGIAAAAMIENPISAELGAMRPSILPNLLDAARRNVARGFASVALFEVGPEFTGGAPGDQRLAASGIRLGPNHGRHWASGQKDEDIFSARADALGLLEALGAPTGNIRAERGAPDYYHPGRSGVLTLGPKNRLAVFGEIHPRILRTMDIDGPVAAFEVYLESLPLKERRRTTKPALAVSDLQAVERDFAFIVDADVAAQDLIAAAQNADKKLISHVSLFDVYQGKGIDEGKKSLAICVRLQPIEATLTDQEIEAVAEKIVAGVNKATGGTLRT